MKKNIIVDIRSMVESCEFARLLKQFPASEECHYIALTPMAFYVLQENGIAYSRIHDFVSEKDFSTHVLHRIKAFKTLLQTFDKVFFRVDDSVD